MNLVNAPRRSNEIPAQGIALGNRQPQSTPCKGKRTITGHRPSITLLPLQGVVRTYINTQGDALGY